MPKGSAELTNARREEILTGKDKIDYRKFKPALFQFPTYEYLETGEILGGCMKMN